jgi:predicted Zn-dependent protease
MRLIVGLAALAASSIVAGVVYATRQDPAQPHAFCARARAQVDASVTDHGGEIRAAMRKPAKEAAQALEQLAAAHPKDPAVQFNDGEALLCAGYVEDASAALRRAKAAGRDTYYEVASDNLLHPQYFQQGYPPFQYFGHDPLLVQGQVAQRGDHQRTAERLWARAARLRPNDADAQVAAAVGRFDMDDLSASFSRLGPLTKEFPRSQSVRFHLALLLAWTGQRSLAVQEFRKTRALGPRTQFGKDASAFLSRLVTGGTNRIRK